MAAYEYPTGPSEDEPLREPELPPIGALNTETKRITIDRTPTTLWLGYSLETEAARAYAREALARAVALMTEDV